MFVTLFIFILFVTVSTSLVYLSILTTLLLYIFIYGFTACYYCYNILVNDLDTNIPSYVSLHLLK